MAEALVLHYRLAGPGDLAAVDALLARSYARLLKADYPPSVLVTALPILSRARPELMRSGSYWVAEAAGEALVAAGGWTPRGAGVGEVRHVVTDAGHVRQGIGTGLMRAAMAQARSAGVGRLDCLATRTAAPFYAALGFVARGEVEIALRPGIGFRVERMDCSL